MKRLISLIKACMTENMNLFRIKNKNQTKTSKKLIPIILTALLFFSFWSYANMIMESLIEVHMEIALLTLFVIFTSIMTLIQGIYKASGLLFNCKDDNLMFSLPIKKSTVLFVRIFKFYVFELIFNTIWLLPVMIAYIRWAEVLD